MIFPNLFQAKDEGIKQKQPWIVIEFKNKKAQSQKYKNSWVQQLTFS